MLIDSHCHFDNNCFDEDRDTCWRHAHAAGVRACVVPATTCAGWPRLRTLCKNLPGLYPAYGLHPVFLHQHHPHDIEILARWLAHEPAVAVGECGLDYFLTDLDPLKQHDFLHAQLAIAQHLGLPVILHARRSVDQVTKALRCYPGIRGVLHSFSGSLQQAQRLLDLDFKLGFGSLVTYPRANRLRRLVTQLPLDAILVETDAPDQPGIQHRGMRNEPQWLTEVVTEIASLRGVSFDVVAQASYANASTLFMIDP